MPDAPSPVPSHRLRPPDAAGLLPRPLPDDTGLLLVVAPAGFGKSSALAQWASRAPNRAAWLTLTVDESDPERLAAALAAALGLPPETPREALLRRLPGRRLALDDLHTIDSPEARALLDRIVDLCPDLTLAIGSRVAPDLPALHRRRVRREVAEVGVDALAFRGESLRALLDESLGLPLEPGALSLLEARTGGWAAAIVLAAQSLAGHAPERRHAVLEALSGVPQDLYDYLAAEVLESLPEALRRFATEASVLPVLRPTPDDAPAVRALERLRLVIPVTGGFVFHHLFAVFLRTRLRETLGSTGYAAHTDAAATQLWERGLLDDALALWQEIGATRTMAQRIAGALSGDTLRLRRWVLGLPETALDPWPALLCLAGTWRGDSHDFPTAQRLLERAHTLYAAAGDEDGVADANLRLVRILRYQNAWDEVARRLDWQAQRLPTDPARRIFHFQEVAFLRQSRDRDLAAAADALDQVQALLPGAALPVSLRASILVQQATMRDRWRGAFGKITAAADALSALYHDAPPTVMAAFIACLHAEVAYQTDAPDARRRFETFADTAREADSAGLLAAAHSFLALYHARFGDREAVDTYLNGAQAHGDMACLAPLARAWQAAHRGDAVTVRAAAETTLHLPVDSVEGAERWRFAEPLLRVGDTDAAARFATLGADAAERAGLPFDRTLAAFWRCAARPDRAALAACLTPSPWEDTLARQSAAPRVLAAALAQGVQVDAAREFLRRRGETAWTVRSFGGLCVARDGAPVAWPRPKARALFVLLWLADGRPQTVDAVVDTLWPESAPEKGRQSYRTHCTYLRQALGAACLTTTQETVRLNLPDALFDDRQMLRRAGAGDDGALQEAALAEAGVEPFLPEFAYETWCAAERETMARMRQVLRLRCAERRLAGRDPEGALPFARDAALGDACDEDAALTLIACLMALDRTGEAHLAWRRLRTALDVAGITLTPSARIAARKLGLPE